jgi:hypothetical protein
MFNNNTKVDVDNDVEINHEARAQVLRMSREQKDSFIVHCKVGDQVWRGLFYERPFLNKHMRSRADVEPIRIYDEGDTFEYLSPIITKQAVVVHQVSMLDKSQMALVEYSWDDTSTEKI